MTWLRGPPLLVACSDNKIADVKKLLALGADPQRAELKVTCRPCDSRTPEERREAMKKECEEKVREWFRKKGIKVQSRDPPA